MPSANLLSAFPARQDRVPFFHDFHQYRRDPLAFWLTTGRQAPVMDVRFGPWMRYLLVTDADFLQHILQIRARQYPRERRLMKLNSRRKVELLFSTDNWEEWLWRRRLMQPAFHRQQIEKFGTVMVTETQKLLETWSDGATLAIENMMKKLTMRIIARTMFSVESLAETRMLQESYEIATDITYRFASSIWPAPLMLLTPRILRLKGAIDRRIAFLETIVANRVREGKVRGDLLDTLISAKGEEKGRALTTEELVWEMSGIVFAGHDTTALTLTWLFYLLTQHEDVARRLEQALTVGLRGATPTVETVGNIPYLEWVILETLRLYPPIYVTIREAEEADQFGDWQIPAGTSLVINVRGIQRDPRYWRNPERFDPLRFSPQRAKGRHKFAFLPFLQGPRKCMGDAFALLEMKIVVATILTHFRFAYNQPDPPRERPSFVMETTDGVPLQVLQR